MSVDLNKNFKIGSNLNNSTDEFFGYLLVSQLEAVEAVNQMESQFSGIKQKNTYLENTIELLKDKCSSLEETINIIKNAFSQRLLQQDNQSLTSLVDTSSSMNVVMTSKNCAKTSTPIPIQEQLNSCNDIQNSPRKTAFSSLIEVCYNLHELENGNEFQNDKTELSKENEQVEKNLIKDFNLSLNLNCDEGSEDCSQSIRSLASSSSNSNCSDASSHECKLLEIRNYFKQTGVCLYCEAVSADFPMFKTCNKNKQAKRTKTNDLENVSEEFKEVQRLFNKRVKYEVNRKFGSHYLAEHQVRELDVKEMHKIRKRVVGLFSPFPLSVKAAWNNAMNSLRQDRHQLKKKKDTKK